MTPTAVARAEVTSIELERLDACPHCGSRDQSFVCRARDRSAPGSTDTFEYSRCGACGVVYASTRPFERDAWRHYGDDYAPYHSDEIARRGARADLAERVLHAWNAAVEAVWRDPWRARWKSLREAPRDDASVLDYGCGSPQYLDAARARGWRTIGADFAAASVERVRRAGHTAWMVGDELWRNVPDGSLDRVRMSHVVEHLYDPRAVLGRLRRALRTGGMIHVATPNAASSGLQRWRDAWFPLECPRHVVLYDARTLRSLLEDTGFRAVETYHETSAKDELRSRGYAAFDRGSLTREAALARADDRRAEEALRCASKWRAARGTADRLHAVARAGDGA